MVRKTKPTPEARAKSRNNVQFHCYDIVNKKMKFSTRDNWIAKNLPTSYCVKHVETIQIDESQAHFVHTIS